MVRKQSTSIALCFSILKTSQINAHANGVETVELELELIQTQMAQKPMLRVEVYARALRASQKRERERMCG